MKRLIIAVLFLANACSLVVLLGLLGSPGHADLLTTEDLEYGRVDLDGDGKYALGDDEILHWLLTNTPQVVEDALKEARLKRDGGIDLSPFLLKFGLREDGSIQTYPPKFSE